MAKPIYVGANISTTDTFSQWMGRTNQIVYDMSTTVVTVGPVAQPNTTNGAWTAGNAHVSGIFSSNGLVASSYLRGGSVSVPANLFVTSNTVFSQAELVSIQANTETFNVSANNSFFGGNFTMSNTSKIFSVTANSTTIAHGPFTVSANSAFTGNNVDIIGRDFTATSNTQITATTINFAGNVTVSGVNARINSTNIYVGDAASDTIYTIGRFGASLIPVGTSINIGNTSLNFGNVHATNGFFSQDMEIGVDTRIGNNLYVSGQEGRFAGMVNANALTARSSINRGLFYSNAGLLETSGNFNYNNGALSVIGTNATTLTFIASGGADISGALDVGLNATVGNSVNIGANANTNNIRVRSMPTNRVPYANSTNYLTSSANFTYNGTTFTITTPNAATVALTTTGSATFGGSVSAGGDLTVVGNSAVNGSSSTTGSSFVGAGTSTNLLTIRSANSNNGVLYSVGTTGNVTSNSTFTYDGTKLTIASTNAQATTIETNGSVSVGRNFNVGGNVAIVGSVDVTGNLRVAGITTLSSDSSLALSDSNVTRMTILSELEFTPGTRFIGAFIPKVNNTSDLGSNSLSYRTVYANNFIGNIAWSSITNRPSPTLTFTGDTTGTGTMTSLGNVSVELVSRNANTTVSGYVTTAAQSFAGAKTFTSTISGSINGNANTATALATSRNINGTAFNGTTNITIPTRIVAANSTANMTVPVGLINNDIGTTSSGDLRDMAFVPNLSYHLATGTLTATDFSSSSDARKKTNIKTIKNALNKIVSLRGVEYDRIDSPSHYVGFIAQEVEVVVPEAVTEDENGFKYVSYGNLGGLYVEGFKDIKFIMDTMKSEIEELRNEIRVLRGQ